LRSGSLAAIHAAAAQPAKQDAASKAAPASAKQDARTQDKKPATRRGKHGGPRSQKPVEILDSYAEMPLAERLDDQPI